MMLRCPVARVLKATTHESPRRAMTATATAPQKPRRIGRKILGSGLLDLLAGPPGVDGYLQQVRRAWGVRERPAEGDFRLPRERPERLLLISGGSGITPVISMLRTLCAESHKRPITFLHYAPDPERAIYRDELDRIAAAHPNVQLVRSYTRSPGF